MGEKKEENKVQQVVVKRVEGTNTSVSVLDKEQEEWLRLLNRVGVKVHFYGS